MNVSGAWEEVRANSPSVRYCPPPLREKGIFTVVLSSKKPRSDPRLTTKQETMDTDWSLCPCSLLLMIPCTFIYLYSEFHLIASVFETPQMLSSAVGEL